MTQHIETWELTERATAVVRIRLPAAQLRRAPTRCLRCGQVAVRWPRGSLDANAWLETW